MPDPLDNLRQASVALNSAMREVTSKTDAELLKLSQADRRPILESDIKLQAVILASAITAACENGRSCMTLWTDVQHECLDLLLLLRERENLNHPKT